MRKLLFGIFVLLAVCGAAIAAGKVSEGAKQRAVEIAAPVKTDLQERMKRTPLNFQEMCLIERNRLATAEGKEEPDPLQSLYSLRSSLITKIRELNPYWSPEEKPRKEVKYIYKEYDIADLVILPPDRPAPAIGFARRQYIERPGEEPEFPGFDWEKIEELLWRTLPGDSEQMREFAYRAGKLICHIPEDDAPRVESLLEKLRQSAGYAVKVEVKFIRTSAKYLGELRKGEGDSAIHLSERAEKRLLDDIAQKKGVELVASSEVIASSGQIVHVREGRQVSFLMDYDINQIGLPTLQPVVRLVNEGLICQFRPVVIRDGKEVVINVRASLSTIRKEVRKGEFMGGDLFFPAMDMTQLGTDTQVPAGAGVLIGGTALSSEEKKDSHEYIIYVKPIVSQKKK